MNDPGLNNLLKWGIENSAASRNDPNAPPPTTQFDVKAMNDFLNGPKPLSDAEVMDRCMNLLKDRRWDKETKQYVEVNDVTLEEKTGAFEDFELLIQGIDNANNLEPLKLWGDLVDQLNSKEPELRMWAAWCAGTAVENNPRSQQRLLILGAIPTLVKLSTEDASKDVRLKAIRALSCVSRNFQPALDAVVENLPEKFKPKGKLDAAEMESVDTLRDALREDAKKLQ